MGKINGNEVLCIGETMASMRASGLIRQGGSLELSIAGSECNVAIGMARLGYCSKFCGVVGKDQFGDLIIRTLRSEDVLIAAIRVEESAPTGLMFVEHLRGDLTNVLYYRKGSAGSLLNVADVDLAFSGSDPDLLHITGITPALGKSALEAIIHAIDLAKSRGSKVSFDLNYRTKLWTRTEAAAVLSTLVQEVDIVFASGDELSLALGVDVMKYKESDAAHRVLAKGPSELVVTHGGGGATVYTLDQCIDRPADPVRAIDTVGAGDAFVSGYLSGALDGLPLDNRLRRAIGTAGFAVTSTGDWEGLPNRDELALIVADSGYSFR